MADLLIRGASLPKSEDENIIIYPDGTVVRFDFARRRSIKEANAVEIPDHGRLIDADELVTMAREYGYELVSVDRIIAAQTIIPASKEGK